MFLLFFNIIYAMDEHSDSSTSTIDTTCIYEEKQDIISVLHYCYHIYDLINRYNICHCIVSQKGMSSKDIKEKITQLLENIDYHALNIKTIQLFCSGKENFQDIKDQISHEIRSIVDIYMRKLINM